MTSDLIEQFMKFSESLKTSDIALIHAVNRDGLSQILEASLAMFDGDKDAGFEWLLTPCHGLGGERPVVFCATAEGLEKILDFIDGIEYGVFA